MQNSKSNPWGRSVPYCSSAIHLILAAILVGSSGCNPDLYEEPASEVAQTEPVFEARKAEVGVGKQGQSLENETGVGKMIAQPAITLFRVKQKAVFEIQIPQALNLYKALEGRMPKDHDEFMAKIIEPNRIALPELPNGQRYEFNPELGELWVVPVEDPADSGS